MSFKTFAYSILALILPSCSTQLSSDVQTDSSKAADKSVWLEGGDARYVGTISNDNNSRLFDIFEENRFKTLHISLSEGSVEDGIVLITDLPEPTCVLTAQIVVSKIIRFNKQL